MSKKEAWLGIGGISALSLGASVLAPHLAPLILARAAYETSKIANRNNLFSGEPEEDLDEVNNNFEKELKELKREINKLIKEKNIDFKKVDSALLNLEKKGKDDLINWLNLYQNKKVLIINVLEIYPDFLVNYSLGEICYFFESLFRDFSNEYNLYDLLFSESLNKKIYETILSDSSILFDKNLDNQFKLLNQDLKLINKTVREFLLAFDKNKIIRIYLPKKCLAWFLTKYNPEICLNKAQYNFILNEFIRLNDGKNSNDEIYKILEKIVDEKFNLKNINKTKDKKITNQNFVDNNLQKKNILKTSNNISFKKLNSIAESLDISSDLIWKAAAEVRLKNKLLNNSINENEFNKIKNKLLTLYIDNDQKTKTNINSKVHKETAHEITKTKNQLNNDFLKEFKNIKSLGIDSGILIKDNDIYEPELYVPNKYQTIALEKGQLMQDFSFRYELTNQSAISYVFLNDDIKKFIASTFIWNFLIKNNLVDFEKDQMFIYIDEDEIQYRITIEEYETELESLKNNNLLLKKLDKISSLNEFIFYPKSIF